MQECDVLIVGGGPAGSSCAWALRGSDLDVVVMDRANFPREKTCAGWVTPPVWNALDVDLDQYAACHTLQPITGFKTGLLGERLLETAFHEVVSYGIRRCEFDQYLLQRCGARLMTGVLVRSLKRADGHWIVNEELAARMLVGAGGNFCPVSRWLGRSELFSAPLITAQEAEFKVAAADLASVHVAGNVPELFFCPDLDGYGWCFRKGSYLNIGLGHTEPDRMKADLSFLLDHVRRTGIIGCPVPSRLHGHAYRLDCDNHRHVVDDGVLLIGDSAGLAAPFSGEGIRPAVESGLAAARAILDANGNYQSAGLRSYEQWFQARDQTLSKPCGDCRLTRSARTALGRSLLRTGWFTRHVLLDRRFLRRVRR